MKYFLRFRDIKYSLNNISKVLNKINLKGDTITILLDEYDYGDISIKQEQKLLNKYKKLLNKMNIPYHNLILSKKNDLLETMERNDTDIFISNKHCQFIVEDSEYIKFLDIDDPSLGDNILNIKNELNKPILEKETFTGYPSIDQIWLKNYTKKQLLDIERLSKDTTSILSHIKKYNKDYLHEVALNINGEEITYYELLKNISTLKKSFTSIGIGYNDVVGICLPNIALNIYARLALQEIGAIPSMIDPSTDVDNIIKIIKHDEIKTMITLDREDAFQTSKYALNQNIIKNIITVPTSKLSLKEELPNNIYKLSDLIFNSKSVKEVTKTNDIAMIMHTKGTENDIKSIALSHTNINRYNDIEISTNADIRRGRSILNTSSMSSKIGLSTIDLALRTGTKIIIPDNYKPSIINKLIAKYNPRIIHADEQTAKNIINQYSKDESNLTSLSEFTISGSPINEGLINRMNEIFRENFGRTICKLRYGITEAVNYLTKQETNHLYDTDTIGLPLLTTIPKIVKKDRNGNYYETNYFENGEICFRGDTIAPQKLNQLNDSYKLHDDGYVWFHTGDYGYIDSEGLLYYKDRVSNIELIEGVEIIPNEIASIIKYHPYVEKCNVVIVKDYKGTRRVVATITLNEHRIDPKIVKKEIMSLCKKRLPKQAIPKLLDIVDDIELNDENNINEILKNKYEGNNFSLSKRKKH